MVQKGDQSFNEDSRWLTAPLYHFDFCTQNGAANKVLENPASLVVTPEIAKKYFGTEDAIGKTLQIQLGENKQLFTISAIADPSPNASSIKYKMLIPFSNAHQLFREGLFHSWSNVFVETYVLLKPGVQIAR
jgi:putative ABC transport system permease protein